MLLLHWSLKHVVIAIIACCHQGDDHYCFYCFLTVTTTSTVVYTPVPSQSRRQIRMISLHDTQWKAWDVPVYEAVSVEVQAKKRTASDCRARFLMLMRARQAASAPQKLHRPAAVPSPAAARPPLLHAAAAAGSTAAPYMLPVLSNASIGPPAALMSGSAQPQPVPTASLHIAAALAAQATQPTPNAVATAPALQPAVAPASLGVATAGAGLISFVPQLSQPQSTAQVLRPQVLQQSLQGLTVSPAQQQATAGSSSSVAGLHPSTQLSSMPASAAAVAAPRRPVSALASLMPGQPATAPTHAAAAVAADNAAVVSSGRGLRLMHKPSLDTLQLKLRLVDLVQGCPALQPKVGIWQGP